MDWVENIKKLAKVQKVSLESIANRIGMTEAGFHYSLNNKTLKIESLVLVAKILNVETFALLAENDNMLNEPAGFYKRLNESERLEIVETELNVMKRKIEAIEKKLK
jgi:transcriptional regulator with XRE-family HTH domain